MFKLNNTKRLSSTKPSRGFTLIELVMVIVILGILAAFAVPKFYNMAGNARTAAFKSVTGSVKTGIANVITIKQGGYPTVGEILANSYTVNGNSYEIIGLNDFELSTTSPTGAELIGTLPAQPASGNWQSIYIYSPNETNAQYYSMFWYCADSGRVVSGF